MIPKNGATAGTVRAGRLRLTEPRRPILDVVRGFLLRRHARPAFDGNIERHDHFTCLSCRRVFDVPRAQAIGPRQRVAIRAGFEVLDHHIELYGVCAACRRRRTRRGTRTV